MSPTYWDGSYPPSVLHPEPEPDPVPASDWVEVKPEVEPEVEPTRTSRKRRAKATEEVDEA